MAKVKISKKKTYILHFKHASGKYSDTKQYWTVAKSKSEIREHFKYSGSIRDYVLKDIVETKKAIPVHLSFIEID